MGRSSLWMACGAVGVVAVMACSTKTETPEGQGGGVSASGGPATQNGTSGGTGGPGADDGKPGGDGKTPAAPRLVTSKETMELRGRTRDYILAKPKDYDENKSYPLVLSFHGNPGNAEAWRAAYRSTRVSKSDAVIAYPGAGNNWDLYTPTGTTPT